MSVRTRRRTRQKAGPSFLSLELLHLLGEHPERPVQAHAPVDAADLASADAPPLSTAAGQTTLQAVLLRTLKRQPETVAPVSYAARRVELLGRDGCRRLAFRALFVTT